MSIRAQLEALIYAAEEPITLDQMAALLKDDLLALKEAAQQNSPLEPSEPDPEHAEEHLGAVEEGATAPGTAPEIETAAEAIQEVAAGKGKSKNKEKSEKAELRALLKPFLEELMAEFNREEHGIEVRQVAGGYRMSTKPEHHDIVRAFSKSLKPPIRLSLQALETLAVIAYKQPVTVPEISEIRGVDAAGVIGTLLERKLITTAGRKAVVGRPMLYKTTKDFLLRFGLKDLNELPSLEEFEKLAAGEMQDELYAQGTAIADATGVPDEEPGQEPAPAADEVLQNGGIEQLAEDKAETPQNVTEPTVSSDPRHTRVDEEVSGEVASESTGG
ncbi:MAG TPA: SMC-Scp complex subunit ScpB [Candidatus Angelobacter sp.]|nr:SMC-Scp complex subunit ScpB [Candidatus Angelobacter sp.]